jgi:hypothetical protein
VNEKQKYYNFPTDDWRAGHGHGSLYSVGILSLATLMFIMWIGGEGLEATI